MPEFHPPRGNVGKAFLRNGAPWLLYAAGSFSGHPAVGSAAAFLLLACLELGTSPLKPVERVLTGFFLLMLIGTAWMPFPWLISCQSYLAPALLAILAFVSLAAGVPFTLAYARESAPESMWHNPHFLLVNKILTVVWGFAFLASAALKYWEGLSPFMTTLLSSLLMLLAALVTKYFPEWYRREIYLPSRDAGKPEILA